MAGVTVVIPTLALQRHVVALGTVWPITVPTAHIQRHVVLPTVPQSALVIIPTLHLTRSMITPFVGGFTPSSATITFAIQHGQHRFDITKADVTPAG